MKKLPFFSLAIFILFSCNKEKALDKDLSKNGVVMSYLIPPSYDFTASKIYTEGTGNLLFAHVDGQGYYKTTDNGETWEKVDFGWNNNISGQISSKGRSIISGNSGRILFSESGGSITFSDQAEWAEYYLDENDDVYYVKKQTSEHELFYIPSGSNSLNKRTTPAGVPLNVINVFPGGGLAFANEVDHTIDIYKGKDDTWSHLSYASSSRQVDPKKIYVGEDSKIYITDKNGIDVISTDGINSIDFPDSLQVQYNPYKLYVTENGIIFTVLANYKGDQNIYEYTNGDWKLFSDDNYPINTAFLEFAVSNNTFYYAGYNHGELISGIVAYNTNSNKKRIIGSPLKINSPASCKMKNGDILLRFNNLDNMTLYKNGNFESTQIPTGIDIFQAKNGNIFILGTNNLRVYDENYNELLNKENFFTDLGFSNYNGYPDSWKITSLNDGSLLMMATNTYTYTLGGTGFYVTKYENMTLSSQDGFTWNTEGQFLNGGYPTLIDYDGKIFYNESYQDAGTFQTITHPKRSDDKGNTFVDVNGPMPNGVTTNGNLISVTKNSIKRWSGKEWNEYNIVFPGGISPEFQIRSIQVTYDNKLIISNEFGLFISDQSL